MQHRILGRSGLSVSALCLGTMLFGEVTDAAEAARIIDQAREQGVNFIDTADAYVDGHSEEVVGRAIAAHRDHWILATKLANAMPPRDVNDRGLSRRHIFAAAHASLRRLGTDVIDVLYWHKEDHATPLEVSVRATADLVRAGAIRHFGLSNHRAWRIAEVCHLCDEEGIDRPVASQPYYSAINRRVEVEEIPVCAHFGLGVVPYSPLARGVLTGKYAPNVMPEAGTRAGRQDRRLRETEWQPESLRAAAQIAEHARARGIEPAAFAVAWVLRNRAVTSVIAGPRTAAQWEEYVKALDVRLDDDDEAFIDTLVSPGRAAATSHNDPAYPIEGRLVAQACRTVTIDRNEVILTLGSTSVIPKGAKNVDGAKDFLRYLIQPDHLDGYLKQSRGRWLPVMESLVKKDPYWFDPSDPHRSVAIKQGVLGPTSPAFSACNPGYGQVDKKEVQGAGEATMIHGATPDDAAEKVLKRIAAIMKQYPIA